MALEFRRAGWYRDENGVNVVKIARVTMVGFEGDASNTQVLFAPGEVGSTSSEPWDWDRAIHDAWVLLRDDRDHNPWNAWDSAVIVDGRGTTVHLKAEDKIREREERIARSRAAEAEESSDAEEPLFDD